MTNALLGLGLGLGGTFLVMVFATHMTLWGDFKYYKQIYESFNRGDYKYSTYGNFKYFKNGREEIIFFPDGAIKLTSDVYIHISFIRWFSPYTLYYMWKFNKVKDSLIFHHELNELRERELNRWGISTPVENLTDSHFADYGPIGPVGFIGRPGPNGNETPVVKDIKPFKLLRG
jgi:hypothetical protein